MLSVLPKLTIRTISGSIIANCHVCFLNGIMYGTFVFLHK